MATLPIKKVGGRFQFIRRLLYNVARKSGLDDPGAQEIVQDTVIAVARKMPEFLYGPARGTFRQWLLRITLTSTLSISSSSATRGDDALFIASRTLDGTMQIKEATDWELMGGG